MSDIQVAALCAEQDGLATRAQARDHLTAKQLNDRLAVGRLQVVRRGVYRAAGAPPTRWSDLRAALLAAGPAALASHRSAAELWGLPGVVADRPEILAPWPYWPRLPGVRSHQSRRIPHVHRAEMHGLAVTTPARTLVDLAAVLPSAGLLGSLVDHCLRSHLTTREDIDDVMALLAGRGRRGVAVLREVLEARRPESHPGDSQGERRLAKALVAAGLPGPEAQHQVVCGPTVYLLDLAYPELRLGIEYDDWHTHGSRTAFDRDRQRGNRLAADGWTILHVTSGMGEAGAVAAIAQAYRRLSRSTREISPSTGQLRGLKG